MHMSSTITHMTGYHNSSNEHVTGRRGLGGMPMMEQSLECLWSVHWNAWDCVPAEGGQGLFVLG